LMTLNLLGFRDATVGFCLRSSRSQFEGIYLYPFFAEIDD